MPRPLARWEGDGTVVSLVRKQRRGEIAVAGIRQQNHNCLTLVLRALGKLNCRPCGRAGLELAALHRVIDHRLGDAILDGTGGVEVLQLCEEPGVEALLPLDVGQL